MLVATCVHFMSTRIPSYQKVFYHLLLQECGFCLYGITAILPWRESYGVTELVSSRQFEIETRPFIGSTKVSICFPICIIEM